MPQHKNCRCFIEDTKHDARQTPRDGDVLYGSDSEVYVIVESVEDDLVQYHALDARDCTVLGTRRISLEQWQKMVAVYRDIKANLNPRSENEFKAKEYERESVMPCVQCNKKLTLEDDYIMNTEGDFCSKKCFEAHTNSEKHDQPEPKQAQKYKCDHCHREYPLSTMHASIMRDAFYCDDCYGRFPPIHGDGDAPQQAQKFDSAKLPLHLIPPEAIIGEAMILGFGATKYSERNWEKGMDWSRIFSAAMRHLWQWWIRAGADPETGLDHLFHARTCIGFLIAYSARNVGNDDRPMDTAAANLWELYPTLTKAWQREFKKGEEE
jgi:hypothetical protein